MAATYRRLISVDFTKCGTQNSTNFTVYVHVVDNTLKGTGSGGHVQNASGFDITFYSNPDQSGILNWEVENYSSTSGTLDAWVQIPTLFTNKNTNFYMFYGDSSISTFQGGAVGSNWDSNFLGVWHLGLNGALSINDTTANQITGTNNNAVTATAGIADGAAAFASASSQSITVGSDPAILQPTAAITVEGWFNTSTASQSCGFIRKNNFGYLLGMTAGSISWQPFLNGNAGSTNLVKAGSWSDGNWHYIVGTYDGLNTLLYGDSAVGAIAGVGGTISYSGGSVHIGANNAANFFNGSLDEMRISNVARSQSYITSTYNNINSPSTFFALGSESLVAPGTATVVESDGDDPGFLRSRGIRYSLYKTILGG